MAVTKLGLYNNSLLLIGQRKLTGLTEDREPRYLLDDAYALDAVDYCLEVVKPRFATKTVTLNSPAVSADHGLDSVHTLPADYLTMVAVYSDDKLDQEVKRYILDDTTIACEHAIIYLRYISDDLNETYTNWPGSFTRVVTSYLAREICLKLSPLSYEVIDGKFSDRVEAAMALDGQREPEKRSTASTTTLNNTWLLIYNDALLIMGLDEITSADDDSNRRAKLDHALNAGIVADLLEETGWTFALSSVEANYDPSLEPGWGHTRVFAKPTDMHRLDGIFIDEYMQVALKPYKDEDGNFYCDIDVIYVQYVSTDWLVNPSTWPTFFRRLVAARMAKDASLSLSREGANVENAQTEFTSRKDEALSNDAVASPPRVLQSGNWTRGRFRGRYNKGRP